ncbi:Type IV fimbrial biogenesis protein PilY1 [Labilithrix luteola]|uniref:Type IV fimbrial biogenesis protein PilY1 n=1 Tax=Labilithrix luteola TaxID=1391654 RepID=A0A0K1PJU9_9BACT|nr:hypothetical protein [Labilithrix luteola]AKU93795.1 Type IV fimbrial biogenesis protein PilY1 [Labilithrix luteola]
MMKRYLLLALMPAAAFVACAHADETPNSASTDGGVPEASPADAGGEDANDSGRDIDAEALRCSNDFCLVDTPPPSAYGFTKWMFMGVQVDPVIGTWAIANGQPGDEGTAQLLRLEDGVWKPRYAPTLGSGAAKRSIRLAALAGDGKGHLIAIGTAKDDNSTVILRSDGVTVTTSAFPGELIATWMTGNDDAWVVGRTGSIHHSVGGGEWTDESNPAGGTFYAIWGSGPSDVYVGGQSEYDPETFESWAYVGHRTLDDAGAPTWTFEMLGDLQKEVDGAGYPIIAGIAPPGGRPFLSAPNVSAWLEADAGASSWVRDPYRPRTWVQALWARSASEVWAAADTGRVYRYDGTTWHELSFFFNGAPAGNHLTGISGTAQGEIFVVGEGIALRRQVP